MKTRWIEDTRTYVKERRKEEIEERGTQRIEEDIQKGRKEERSKEGRK